MDPVALYPLIAVTPPSSLALDLLPVQCDRALLNFLQANPLPTLIWNLEFQVIFGNAAATDLFGLDLEELIGVDASQLLAGQTLGQFPVEVFFDQPQVAAQIRKVGSPWVDWSNTPQLDQAGQRTCVVSMIQPRTAPAQAISPQFPPRSNAWSPVSEPQILRGFVENSSDLFFVHDLSGTLLYLSPNVEALWGYSPQDLMGQSFHRVLHPEDVPIIWHAVEHMVRQKTKLTGITARVLHQSGEFRWAEANSAPLLDEAGHIIGIQGIWRDITEYRRIYQEHEQLALALDESEARLSRLTENIPGMLFRCQWQPGGVPYLTYVSAYSQDLLGFAPEVMLHCPEIWEHLILPEDKADILDLITTSAQSLTPFSWEGRCKVNSGKINKVGSPASAKNPGEKTKWVQVFARPVRCQGGVSWDGIMLDISDRKLIEQQLQASQQFLYQLIDQFPDPIFVKTRQHEWHLVNQAFCDLHGYSRHQLLGKIDYEIYSEEEADIIWTMDEHIFITEEDDVNEDYVEGLAQGSRYISTKKTSLRTHDGKQFLVGIMRDISDRKRAEDQIKATQQFLNRVLDAIPDPIFVKNAAGRFVLVNRAGADLLNVPREKILNCTDYDFVPASQADIFVAHDHKVMESGQEDVNEEYHTNSQGQERFVSTKKICFTDPRGNKLLIAALRDITDRKRVEEALQTSELEMRTLLAAMTDVVLVLDKSGRYLKVAPTNPKLLYKPDRELVGRTLHEVMPLPEADRFLQLIQQVLTTQKTHHLDYSLEVQGEVVWFEGSFSSMGTDQVLLVARDISERKQAEAERHQSELRLAAAQDFLTNVLDGLADPVFVKDENHRWILLNRAMEQIMQRDRTLMIGYSNESFFSPEEVAVFWAMDDAVLQSEQETTNEEYITDGLGQRRYISTKKTCVRNQAGQKFLVGSIRDLTQRKQMEDALRSSENQSRNQAIALEQALQALQQTQAQLIQSEKMSSLGQLVAGVAHEINNPVNFIYANLSYAEDYAQAILGLLKLYQSHYPETPPQIQQYAKGADLNFVISDLPKILHSMQLGAERIQEIVLSLRTFSRLDEAEYKTVDLHEGIESTLMILQSRLKNQLYRPAIELIRQYGDLPKVRCYAGPLNQVVMNLLCNAIDVLDEASHREQSQPLLQPRIILRTRAIAEAVEIQVIDNGPGIPRSIQPRIFDPFFTTKPIGKGTGMGLSISYQIIAERHGGQLAYAFDPEVGSIFTITIPQA